MPRIKWIGTAKPEKKVKEYNALAATLRGYKLASGLTSREIGEKLGLTEAHVRHMIGRAPDEWNIGKLKELCAVIGCPAEEALRAASFASKKGA